jgi:hydroxymethylbilane synthase
VNKTHWVLGSRQSQLAIVQTEAVISTLQGLYPEWTFDIKLYQTQGDVILDKALSKIGDKGLFVKELEVALLQGEIDMAIHSLKDMPAVQPEGLYLVPFGKRENPYDAMVSHRYQHFEDLPEGARVGTSSLRRQAQLLALRPDLDIHPVRGNIQTRLEKLEREPYDAIILAAAGLYRLGIGDRICYHFPPEQMIPASCQGILGIEFTDSTLAKVLPCEENTRVAAEAERLFLSAVDGGCQVPQGCFVQPVLDQMAVFSGLDTGQGFQRQHKMVAREALLPTIQDMALALKLG